MNNGGEQKTTRFNMFMSPSEMAALDEWAWKNRIRSKSEAARRLINMGIRGEPLLADFLKLMLNLKSKPEYDGSLDKHIIDLRRALEGEDSE